MIATPMISPDCLKPMLPYRPRHRRTCSEFPNLALRRFLFIFRAVVTASAVRLARRHPSRGPHRSCLSLFPCDTKLVPHFVRVDRMKSRDKSAAVGFCKTSFHERGEGTIHLLFAGRLKWDPAALAGRISPGNSYMGTAHWLVCAVMRYPPSPPRASVGRHGSRSNIKQNAQDFACPPPPETRRPRQNDTKAVTKNKYPMVRIALWRGDHF